MVKFGTILGIALGGLDMWINTHYPGRLRLYAEARQAGLRDAEAGGEAKPIAYPKPDGMLDLRPADQRVLSGTNHEEDQPVHFKLTDPSVPVAVNLPEFAEPAQRYCPAAVYEMC